MELCSFCIDYSNDSGEALTNVYIQCTLTENEQLGPSHTSSNTTLLDTSAQPIPQFEPRSFQSHLLSFTPTKPCVYILGVTLIYTTSKGEIRLNRRYFRIPVRSKLLISSFVFQCSLPGHRLPAIFLKTTLTNQSNDYTFALSNLTVWPRVKATQVERLCNDRAIFDDDNDSVDLPSFSSEDDILGPRSSIDILHRMTLDPEERLEASGQEVATLSLTCHRGLGIGTQVNSEAAVLLAGQRFMISVTDVPTVVEALAPFRAMLHIANVCKEPIELNIYSQPIVNEDPYPADILLLNSVSHLQIALDPGQDTCHELSLIAVGTGIQTFGNMIIKEVHSMTISRSGTLFAVRVL